MEISLGEGAAGTIIWLVNCGTTDGVNNPLLTATKKAFLDPNAVEPGPYPLPPAPRPSVSVSFDKPNDRGSGWCGTLTVKNVGDMAGWFVAETDFPDRDRPVRDPSSQAGGDAAGTADRRTDRQAGDDRRLGQRLLRQGRGDQ